MSEFLTALKEWVPTQVSAAQYELERTTATEREMFTAQGALKVLRKLQSAIESPSYEFGNLWRPDEDKPHTLDLKRRLRRFDTNQSRIKRHRTV